MERKKICRTTTALLSLVFALCSTARAADDIRLDDSGRHLVMDRAYLKKLVLRLEDGGRAREENAELRKKMELWRRYGKAARQELEGRKELSLRLERALSLHRETEDAMRKRMDAMLENERDFRAAMEEGKRYSAECDAEKAGLRRELAGQKMATWGVSAVGGALLLLFIL